jgi:uracil-DNA glycosylase
MGKFLRVPDKSYEAQCNRILIDQISLIKPRVLLLLGPEVASRAYQIAPALAPWRGAKRWIDIDRSNIGPFPRDVEIPGAGLRVNVTAILHPSFGAANEGRRMRNMLQPITEAELIRAAIID